MNAEILAPHGNKKIELKFIIHVITLPIYCTDKVYESSVLIVRVYIYTHVIAFFI